MPSKRDYYEVLDLKKDASPDDITRAYRKLVMQYHPDRNGGDRAAEEQFKEVAEAHEVLRDPEKRRRYDRYGHAGLEGMNMPDFSGADAFSSVFSGIFDTLFGAGSRGPQSGRDLQIQVELDLAEAASGVSRELKVPSAELCATCHGTGAAEGSKPKTCPTCQGRRAVIQGNGFFRVQRECPTCRGRGQVVSDPCKKCQGHGRVRAERTVPVDIPPGVDSGMSFVVEGEGEPGEMGAQRGDLYVALRVRPHPLFERHGDDLICQAFITYSQAALGCEIEIPTVDGKRLKQTLPRGIQSGEAVKLPGHGMPNVRGRRKGSLLVQIIVETPRNLTKRQEELLTELAELDAQHVSPQRKGWLDRIKSFFTDSSKK